MKSYDLIYVLHREEPSETFIRREIDALRAISIPVRVYVLDAPQVKLAIPPGLRRALLHQLVIRLLAPPFSLSYAARLIRQAPRALRLAAEVAPLACPRLHAQFAWSAADASALAAAALGIPWTCSVHAWDVFTRPLRETRARLATAAGVTACTRRAADALRAAGIPEARIRVIRHGLDSAAFPFDPERPAGRIAAVGRLVPKKGFDTLLDACALLRKAGVPFTCTLVGDGPERGRLEWQAAAAGIADAVIFTGWIAPDAAQRIIAGATVLVHPSRRLANADTDGFPNVLSEAMFLGTPIVTTPAGAAAELLCDCARFVPSDDPEALAEALATLLRNPETCRHLAAAARQTADTHLNQTRLIRQLAAFLEERPCGDGFAEAVEA
jgi:colanic acid/amylovoran biosynthesis glycosyltransferase